MDYEIFVHAVKYSVPGQLTAVVHTIEEIVERAKAVICPRPCEALRFRAWSSNIAGYESICETSFGRHGCGSARTPIMLYAAVRNVV